MLCFCSGRYHRDVDPVRSVSLNRLNKRAAMMYARNSTKSSAVMVLSMLVRFSVLGAAGIALFAAPVEAQTISYGLGTYTYGAPTCGVVGWLPPGPTTPNVGWSYPSGYTFVVINGQLVYAPPATQGCLTGGNNPTGGNTPTDGPTGAGPSPDFFVQGGDGGGGSTGSTPDDTPEWTGDGKPDYPNLDTPLNPPTVTPEPNTLVLLASGLAGVGVVVRRRRRKGHRHIG